MNSLRRSAPSLLIWIALLLAPGRLSAVDLPGGLDVGKPIVSYDFQSDDATALKRGEIEGTRGTFEVMDGALLMTSEKSNPTLSIRGDFPENITLVMFVDGLRKNHKLDIILPNGVHVEFNRQYSAVGAAPQGMWPFSKDEEPLAIERRVYDLISGENDEIVVATLDTKLALWVNGVQVLETKAVEPASNSRLQFSCGFGTKLAFKTLHVFPTEKLSL